MYKSEDALIRDVLADFAELPLQHRMIAASKVLEEASAYFGYDAADQEWTPHDLAVKAAAITAKRDLAINLLAEQIHTAAVAVELAYSTVVPPDWDNADPQLRAPYLKLAAQLVDAGWTKGDSK